VAAIGIALVAAGCGTARADYIRQLEAGAGSNTGASSGAAPSGDAGPTLPPGQLLPDPAQVGVQLDTFFSATAAGMYNADVSGLYEQAAIEVGFIPGTPDEDPIAAASASEGPEFLLASLPAVLKAREAQQTDLVLIAQLFQRSGMMLVAPTGTSLEQLSTLKGKPVGLLSLGGRSLDAQAALAAAGLKPGRGYETVGDYDFVTDPAIVPATGLLRSETVAAMQVTRYDEYAQLLEFGTEDGQAPYLPQDLAVREFDTSGDAMLSEGLFARKSWLADPGNREVAVRFLRATFAGYAGCRDAPADCAQLVVDQGGSLPVGHQAWAMNEVNALIWPSPAGIGSLADGAVVATVSRLLASGLLTQDPDGAAVDMSIAAQARDSSNGVDLLGGGFVKGSVVITPGGEGATPVEPEPTDEALPTDGAPAGG
jgi:NitT/TauT family transport system substrate-binding protein